MKFLKTLFVGKHRKIFLKKIDTKEKQDEI
jgi:hypothetical protein